MPPFFFSLRLKKHILVLQTNVALIVCDFEKDDGEIKDSYMYRQKSPIVTFLIENHVLYTNKSYAVAFSI